MKRLTILLAALFCFALTSALAQDTRPYSEGSVTVVTAVKVAEGQYDNYMGYLAKTYKPLMEAQKKAGHILAWNVYATRPRSADEADVYLTVTYANMAAFDGMYERMSPIQREITGMSREQTQQAAAGRGSMRTILGSEVIRELVLK